MKDIKYKFEGRTIEGINLEVNDLIEIRSSSDTYTLDNFNKFILKKNHPYSFIGENEVLSINANDLYYASVIWTE